MSAGGYVVDFDVPPDDPIKLDVDDEMEIIHLPSGQIGDLQFRVRPEWTVIHFAPNGTSTAEYYPEQGGHTVAIDPTKDKYEQSGDSYNVKVDIGRLSLSSVQVTQDKYSYIVEPEQSAKSSAGNTVLRNATGVEDPTTAAKAATAMACSKLKEAYGDNIRIYLVKYRKSDGDYTYLDNCATSTGGKSYDAGDSAALKSTLDTIAADLKTWAEYKEARVVN